MTDYYKYKDDKAFVKSITYDEATKLATVAYKDGTKRQFKIAEEVARNAIKELKEYQDKPYNYCGRTKPDIKLYKDANLKNTKAL